MGLLNFLTEIGGIMIDSSREKSLEELCNAINSTNSLSNSLMLGSNSIELGRRLGEMDNDELVEYFQEYSQYRVKNAARCFITIINGHISTMKNMELVSVYNSCCEIEDSSFKELADKVQRELKRRGYI